MFKIGPTWSVHNHKYSYKENQGGFSAWLCLAPKNADEVAKTIKKLKGCQTITYKYLKLSTEIWSPHVLFERKHRVAVCSVLRGAVLTRTWSALASTNGGIVNRTIFQQCKVCQLSIYQSLRDYLGQQPSYLPTQLCGIICNPAVGFCIVWGLIHGYRNKNSAHMPECK